LHSFLLRYSFPRPYFERKMSEETDIDPFVNEDMSNLTKYEKTKVKYFFFIFIVVIIFIN
jgi:hypothetical protein